MKFYLRCMMAFALTTLVQATSAQVQYTPRLTIINGGAEVTSPLDVFAGSDITFRVAVDLADIVNLSPPLIDTTLTGARDRNADGLIPTSSLLDFASGGGPAPFGSLVGYTEFDAFADSDNFLSDIVIGILVNFDDLSPAVVSATAMTTINSGSLDLDSYGPESDLPITRGRPAGSASSSFNFLDFNLVSATNRIDFIRSNSAATLPVGIWCPAPVGGACALTLGDVTLSLPADIGTGPLAITMISSALQLNKGLTDPVDAANIDTAPGTTGIVFNIASGYEFAITSTNDTDTTDADVDVIEGATAEFTVNVSPALPAIAEEITVPWTVTPGTAEAADLAGGTLSGNLVFAAGDTEEVISIPIEDDMLVEGAEMFTLALGTPAPATTNSINITADTTAVDVAIASSDMLSVGLDDASVAIIDQSNVYPVSLTENQLPTGATLTVTYTIAGSGAAAAVVTTDYVDTTGGTLTINAGETSADIQIDIPAAATDGREFTITLSPPTMTGGGTGAPTPVLTAGQENRVITIRQGYVVSVADVTVAEADGMADVTVSVTPAIPAGETLSVMLNTSNGTAMAGEDYTAAVNTSVSFAATDTSQMVSIPISDDVITEAIETFTVTLSAPNPAMLPLSGATVPVLADDVGTVTIAANDMLSAGLAPASVAVIDQTTMYPVSLTGANRLPASGAATLTVGYTIAGTAGGGATAAVVTTDYVDTSGGSVTINAGETSANIEITIPDTATEDREFTITLGTPTLAGITGAPTPVIATGQESSGAIRIVMGFAISIAAPADPVVEGAAAEFTVTLTSESATSITVPWTVAGMAGAGFIAAEADDFSPNSGSITFAAGDTTATVSVTAVDDNRYEGEEGFTVTLGTPSPATADFPASAGGATGLPVSLGMPSAEARISTDPLTILVTGNPRAREGQTAEYTVALDGDVVGINLPDVMVSYSLTPGEPAMGAGDDAGPPTPGSLDANGDVVVDDDGNVVGDFLPPTPASPLTILTSMGESQATVSIVFLDDEIDDTNETLSLTLDSLSGGGDAADIMLAAVNPNDPDGRACDGPACLITIIEVDLEQRAQATQMTLSAFGRTVGGNLVRMMEVRTAAARAPSRGVSQATIGGRTLALSDLRSTLRGDATGKGATVGDQPDSMIGGNTARGGGGMDSATNAGRPAVLDEALAVSDDSAVRTDFFKHDAAPTGDEAAATQLPLATLVRDSMRLIGVNVGSDGVSFHPVDLRQMLASSSFQFALNGGGGLAPDALTVWGRGSASNFEGKPQNNFSMDGDVFSGQIGVDLQVNPDMLAGIALNYSEGDSDYTFTGGDTGEIDTDLTSVHPYIYWAGKERVDLWLMLGYGEGDATLEDESGSVSTDLDMKMAATGIRKDVAPNATAYLDWALKADAFFMRLNTDEQADQLNAVEADTWQLRMVMEGSRDLVLTGDSTLRGITELAWRLDGGDAETGMGIEIGGGLDYANPGLGMTVAARGHYLLAHRESDFDEWGLSLTAAFDPGVVGRGLQLSLAPSLGAASGGADRLWEDNSLIKSAVNDAIDADTPDMTMGFEAAYGLSMPNDRGLLTPFSGLHWSGQDNARARLGTRMQLAMPNRMEVAFDLYGEQAYATNSAAAEGGFSGVLDSRVRRSFAHDMGVVELFSKLQGGGTDEYQVGIETKINF